MTTRLRFTTTRSLLVDVPADEAERLLRSRVDYLDVCEAADRYNRMAHHAPHYYDVDLSVEEAETNEFRYMESSVLDATSARPGYLWSAGHFVGKARHVLDQGRYREGHCPDLDRVNVALGRLEEELRLMALADDPDTAVLAESERARARSAR